MFLTGRCSVLECIYGSWACDGEANCYDGSEEVECGGYAGHDGVFAFGARSAPYGQCIYGSWACDGAADCYDGSDEADCGGSSPECEDCEFDFTPYGAECCDTAWDAFGIKSEEHTSELQSRRNLVCRLLLEKKKSLLLSRLHKLQFLMTP